MARLLARPLGRELDAQVVIDNRPGASGNIGTKQVMTSKPDGLTLVHTTIAMRAINPLMYPDQDFNSARDLVPVGVTGALPNVLGTSVEANTAVGQRHEVRTVAGRQTESANMIFPCATN